MTYLEKEVNVSGIQWVRRMVGKREGFYLFFRDMDDPEPEQCPSCCSALQRSRSKNFKICRVCCIAI